MADYTGYCTAFYDKDDNAVYFWDEIKDKKIRKQKVADKAEADKVMQDWKAKAPKGVICDLL